jgi:hypothetical protein
MNLDEKNQTIKFVKDFNGYKSGESTEVNADRAQKLIASGYAQKETTLSTLAPVRRSFNNRMVRK